MTSERSLNLTEVLSACFCLVNGHDEDESGRLRWQKAEDYVEDFVISRAGTVQVVTVVDDSSSWGDELAIEDEPLIREATA